MFLLRAFYTLVMYLLTPVILYRLAWRGIGYRDYWGRWRERFGFFADPKLSDTIWIHAVSVGEMNAAAPLIEALMKRFEGRRFVVTTVTPTGSARVQKLFGERVFHVYLPYDLTASIRRFLDRINPSLAVVMETEIWPNLYYECAPVRAFVERLRSGATAGARSDPLGRLRRRAVTAGCGPTRAVGRAS